MHTFQMALSLALNLNAYIPLFLSCCLLYNMYETFYYQLFCWCDTSPKTMEVKVILTYQCQAETAWHLLFISLN